MPSKDIICYDIFKQVIQYSKKDNGNAKLADELRYLAKTGLNSPKLVMITDAELIDKDSKAGRAFMTKHGFHMPFDTLVVECHVDGSTTPVEGSLVFMLRISHESPDYDMRPVLHWNLFHDRLNGRGVTAVSGFSVWNQADGFFELPSDIWNNPQHKEAAFAAHNVFFALNTIMIQCRTKYLRYATRQRTSRHPLPEHWNAEPFYSYSVVTKDRFPNPKAIAEYKSSIQVRQRRHKRMGHWRFYKSGKVIWIDEYEAGDARLGYKFKDYELQPPAKHH